MPQLNITQLSLYTGKAKETINKSLDGIPFTQAKTHGGPKLYNSKIALEKIYCAPTTNGAAFTTKQEADRLYVLARRDQVVLEMECKRKERIPLEDIEELNNKIFSNVAGMIKAQEGKVFSGLAIQEILTELRGLSEGLKEVVEKPAADPMDDPFFN